MIADIVDLTEISSVDYLKFTEKTLVGISNPELFKSLPKEISIVGDVLDYKIQAYNINDELIKDIHQFNNNRTVKIAIKKKEFQ